MAIDPDNVELRRFLSSDADWLVERHAALYAERDGFDGSFRDVVADIVDGFLRDHDPATERGWIAAAGDRRLGSIFCVQSGEEGIAKLRLFLLEPDARGLGLGQRLLEACIKFAKDKEYRSMRLWTHESHRAACVLYARYGFLCVDAFPVRSFGQDLVEQTWELDLQIA